ncbi:MAG: L,D-transpeptidase family protein [Bacillus sp. (in: Bacteria)]|nr:L,D-transpeptidase family protein [Bacillus sp. (in: firmicutes)]
MSTDQRQQEFIPRSKKYKRKQRSNQFLYLVLIGVSVILIGAASTYALGNSKENAEASVEDHTSLLQAREISTKSPTKLQGKETSELTIIHLEEETKDETEDKEELMEEEVIDQDYSKHEEIKEVVPIQTTEKEKQDSSLTKQPELIHLPELVVDHEVRLKETLFSITMTYFTSSNYLDKIAQFNQIANPSTDIKAGMVIKIPDPEIVAIHRVSHGETLYSITRNYYNTTEHLISLALYNEIIDPKSDVKAGMDITIPHPQKLRDYERNNYVIHINKTTNTLSVYRNSELVRRFPVATGRDISQTPEGIFQIANKVEKPWYNPKNIPGGAPENPLGSHWLGLNVPGTNNFIYGIHGTNDPSSIGNYVSLGCIRMHNEDVLWMYNTIPLNTSVYIFRN